jgi:hypothetical protein
MNESNAKNNFGDIGENYSQTESISLGSENDSDAYRNLALESLWNCFLEFEKTVTVGSAVWDACHCILSQNEKEKGFI